MAVWSAIPLSQVATAARLDAEYYKPDYLTLANSLERMKPITVGAFAYVTDGIHASPDIVEEGGVCYLSAKCVKDNEFALGDTLFISEAKHRANKRTQMKIDDVLLITVGTIGNAAVATIDYRPVASEC
ncbi:MAG: hypothetical protein HYY96_06390 [Candidatus Tectomicrobia bacterium]|nr:hypothetical protein [Candidatus Tectomicrobia bacterium]